MAQGAELLFLLLGGMGLFRLARPLRDRLETWFVRNFPASRRNIVVDLHPRSDGVFGAEDPDGD